MPKPKHPCECANFPDDTWLWNSRTYILTYVMKIPTAHICKMMALLRTPIAQLRLQRDARCVKTHSSVSCMHAAFMCSSEAREFYGKTKNAQVCIEPSMVYDWMVQYYIVPVAALVYFIYGGSKWRCSYSLFIANGW